MQIYLGRGGISGERVAYFDSNIMFLRTGTRQESHAPLRAAERRVHGNVSVCLLSYYCLHTISKHIFCTNWQNVSLNTCFWVHNDNRHNHIIRRRTRLLGSLNKIVDILMTPLLSWVGMLLMLVSRSTVQEWACRVVAGARLDSHVLFVRNHAHRQIVLSREWCARSGTCMFTSV